MFMNDLAHSGSLREIVIFRVISNWRYSKLEWMVLFICTSQAKIRFSAFILINVNGGFRCELLSRRVSCIGDPNAFNSHLNTEVVYTTSVH